jgi:hypothetical protein
MSNIDELPKMPSSPLEDAITQLRRTSTFLRQVGLALFISTLSSLASFLFYIFVFLTAPSGSYYRMSYIRESGLIPTTIALFMTIASFVLIAFHENARKRGETIFEEISDEVHWNINGSKNPDTAPAFTPPLQIRLALRSFARATDLHLAPGKFGATLYAALNLGIIFAMVLLAAMAAHP